MRLVRREVRRREADELMSDEKTTQITHRYEAEYSVEVRVTRRDAVRVECTHLETVADSRSDDYAIELYRTVVDVVREAMRQRAESRE
jgi:hypothetical protein